MKRAKIICTIGPATSSKKMLDHLIRNGMDVARLNFSHGSHEDHQRYIADIRDQSSRLSKPVAILQDLQGIKIRIGDVANGSVRLKRGQKVILKHGNDLTTKETLFISYPALVKDLRKGQRVLLDDGMMELRVTDKGRNSVTAKVREGGLLTAHKGVNLPDASISLVPFTDKDRADLCLGIKHGVDAIALSFVLKEDDIRTVKNWLRDRNVYIPVIAKIEKPEALLHLDAILEEAEGIMVARGDLGVEMPADEIPLIQKKLIRRANEKRKIVITATQMLESMREHLRPTRAEITDVANAVIDGTDALMLSAETSTGKYPLEALMTMRRIIETTERKGRYPEGVPPVFSGKKSMEDMSSSAVVASAVRAAENIGARCIVAFTRSGFTALLISKCRPTVPVIAFTPEEAVINRMYLYWGITPLYMRLLSNTDEMVFEVEKRLIDLRMAKSKDIIVIIASSPLHAFGKTNFMKIHKIG